MKACSTSLICLNQTTIDSDFNHIMNIGNGNNKCDFNWAHADFMDGHFVPRLGIAPEVIKHLREYYGDKIIIDSHMMVDDPFTFADVVCPYSDYYMFHVEAVKDPMRTIQKVRKNWPNVKVGLYFNLSTNILDYKYILPEIDCIGLMGISPGVLGTNSYSYIVTQKIRDYFDYKNEIEKDSNIELIPSEIFIDGSVNFETIPHYFKIGATTLVCGSSSIVKNVYNNDDNFRHLIEMNIDKIEKSI
jgi:ribulose-phosphate 3-epimerase